MVIVPHDSVLEIEAQVLNKDIGFVRAGQPAAVKIESFPFTKYGLIEGGVVHVSADAIPNKERGLVYAVRVAMKERRILVGQNWEQGLIQTLVAQWRPGENRHRHGACAVRRFGFLV